MRRRETLISSMVKVICSYFLTHEAKDFNIRVQNMGAELQIVAKGHVNIDDSEIFYLSSLLEQANGPEVELYYSELLNTSEEADLRILGHLVDNFIVSYEEGILQINISKNFEMHG